MGYIEDHLDEPIGAAELARTAMTSEYHFRRMFSAPAGIRLSQHRVHRIRAGRGWRSPRKTPGSVTHGVAVETRAEVRRHYDDDQLASLVRVISLINAATRMNVIVHNPGGSYEPGTFASTSS